MANKTTFKDLDKKQKIEHIWEYYRWHIIGSILGVAFVISLIGTILRPRPPVHAADMIVSGLMRVDDVLLEQTNQMLAEKFNVGVEAMPANWKQKDGMTIGQEQAMMLKIQVRECDVLAISPYRHEGFMTIENFDAFARLDEIPELQPLLEKYKDNLITQVSKEDGKEHVYGIETTTLNHIEGIQLEESMIVSMLTNTKDRDAAISLIQYILE